VFEVHYHRESGTASWNDISGNLGDQPILGVAFDPQTGRLYAATDYGVVVRESGASAWGTAGSALPPVAVYQLVIDSASRSLYAVTHGRGIYRLDL
jgi:DNA-binding beta-propeller fold protein YncE